MPQELKRSPVKVAKEKRPGESSKKGRIHAGGIEQRRGLRLKESFAEGSKIRRGKALCSAVSRR